MFIFITFKLVEQGEHTPPRALSNSFGRPHIVSSAWVCDWWISIHLRILLFQGSLICGLFILVFELQSSE